MFRNKVDFHGTIIAETLNAVKFIIDGYSESMWFPKSCIDYDEPKNKHNQTTIEMTKWYAEKRGL